MVGILAIFTKPASWIKHYAVSHPILTTIYGIVLLLVVWFLYALFRPVAPQYITAIVKRGDLVQKVEAVGTVTSDQALNLKFPTTGIVQNVAAKEGNRVSAGQLLVSLRNGSQSADLAAASAQYAQALAGLQELQQGTRSEDIAIAEANVESSRASLNAAKADLQSAKDKLKASSDRLDAIKNQATTNLAGYIQTAVSICQQQIALSTSAISSLDSIVTDPTIQILAQQYATTDWGISLQRMASAKAGLAAAQMQSAGGFATFKDALATLQTARAATADGAFALQKFYDIVGSLPLTGSFPASSRDADKTSIATQKATVQAALTALDSATKSLQDASAGYDTSLTSEQANFEASRGAAQSAESAVNTNTALLASQEAQLALKKAGPRDTTIAASQASTNAAAANVARARAQLENSIIRAPADGVITKIDYKLGEFTGDPANASHSVTMLGTSPYRIEMFLSEVDIPKVVLTQTGSIELDAFPGVHYALKVSSTEPGPTLVDGVSKYRVTLNFAYPHTEFKIGMTGDGEIITGERRNVLLVPVRAIIQNPDGTKIIRILDKGNVVEKPVTTGMESDTDAEVVSGVSEGETVVVLIKK
ncbi:MAG: efflux RND transporter periplasmic adaptor subunit [Candidatus Peregrinibacteria bacterium]